MMSAGIVTEVAKRRYTRICRYASCVVVLLVVMKKMNMKAFVKKKLVTIHMNFAILVIVASEVSHPRTRSPVSSELRSTYTAKTEYEFTSSRMAFE